MDRAEAFLKRMGFLLETPDLGSLLPDFEREMAAGLAGGASSLQMIPAYLSVGQPVPVGQPVIVLDAGGTHLRAGLVDFNAHGMPTITRFTKHRMPGTDGPITARAFYDTLADCVAPLASEADTVGFCFSYPAEINPDCDARLLRWTKQVQAPEVVGTRVGSSLRDCLAARGLRLRVTVLNDTVATLLAGRSVGMERRYETYVGFILGTGTNTAYVERHAAITKVAGLPAEGAMAINVESGNFARAPRSRFDDLFDATTGDPGTSLFEKMISGAYLGGLGLTILREASMAGLFSAAVAAAIGATRKLATKDLDDFCHNPFIRSGAVAALPLSDDDRRLILALCTPMFARAACFTAVNIAAAVLKTGAGRDPLHPVCVTVDGSTYYRTLTASFKSRVEEHLRRILGGRGIAYDLIHVDEAPVIGAAVAGLSGA
ncbi:MAG: hexokinase [Lentisphaerae bacterium]|nr:hexokinase [Lentisphaerota bacterium]